MKTAAPATRNNARPTAAPRGRSHKTVRVRVGRTSANIDIGIAPLIKALWRLGVSTWCSCENAGDTIAPDRHGILRHGFVQVGFVSQDDASKFLSLVAKFEKGGRTLYNRITHEGCRGVRCWDYEIGVYDHAYDWDSDSLQGPSDLGFRVFIYIPKKDVLRVTKRLERVRRDHDRREAKRKNAPVPLERRVHEDLRAKLATIGPPRITLSLDIPTQLHELVATHATRLTRKTGTLVTFDAACVRLLVDALDESPKVSQEVERFERRWRASQKKIGKPVDEGWVRKVARVVRGRARAEEHIDELLAMPALPGNAMSFEAAIFLPRSQAERENAASKGSK